MGLSLQSISLAAQPSIVSQIDPSKMTNYRQNTGRMYIWIPGSEKKRKTTQAVKTLPTSIKEKEDT
eukprot:1139457-Pelagomonas_calceolata.AAC.4